MSSEERPIMRIALAGKGGAGKTTIAATLARLTARAGARVLAIDADSNPNLGAALGIDARTAPVDHLPAALVSRRLDGAALTVPVEEVIRAYGLPGPDGVDLVCMGAPEHAGEGCLCSAHATVSAVLADLGSFPAGVAVVDMEASPEQLSRGTVQHADVLLLIAEPYFRSLETVRRLAALSAELSIAEVAVVANKLRSAADREAIAEFCERHGLRCWGEVPWSEEVVRADLAACPLLDSAPEGVAVAAIAQLSTRLGDLELT
jgi:CO dehydrogenase maturation factor